MVLPMLRRSRKVNKEYAVKISVKVRDEIRIWDTAPDQKTAILWQEKELLNEMKDVGMIFDYEIVPVPMDKLEEAKQLLNN